jgi:hypothetical protein
VVLKLGLPGRNGIMVSLTLRNILAPPARKHFMLIPKMANLATQSLNINKQVQPVNHSLFSGFSIVF